jgi:putative transposase
MPNYQRARVPGGTFFFTIVSWRRRPILCHPVIRASLRVAITTVREVHPFRIDAWVLLPDHLHCVWTLPEGDVGYSVRWSKIKRFVTQRVEGSVNGAHGAPYGHVTRSRRREGRIWQRRFWEHQVRDQLDMARCLDYLHWNPVKHGYVRSVGEWPYSSFHRYVQQGHYPAGWGGPVDADEGVFGE